MSSLESRPIRADIMCYKMLHGLVDIDCHMFFLKLTESLVTRGHQFKLCKPLCPAFIANTFCYCVVNTWNALPANIVSATSLAMFKARLNGLDVSKFAVLF